MTGDWLADVLGANGKWRLIAHAPVLAVGLMVILLVVANSRVRTHR